MVHEVQLNCGIVLIAGPQRLRRQ